MPGDPNAAAPPHGVQLDQRFLKGRELARIDLGSARVLPGAGSGVDRVVLGHVRAQGEERDPDHRQKREPDHHEQDLLDPDPFPASRRARQIGQLRDVEGGSLGLGRAVLCAAARGAAAKMIAVVGLAMDASRHGRWVPRSPIGLEGDGPYRFSGCPRSARSAR